MGLKLKTPKGEISISNNAGRIRLRWRFTGVRYSLNLPFAYQEDNFHYAKVKIAEIKLDMMKGCFDGSLQKYEYPTTPKPSKPKKEQLSPIPEATKLTTIDQLAEKFTEWGKNIRNIDVDNAVDYLYVRKWLEKERNVSIYSIAEKLNTENWAATTYNRRLYYLNIFLSWLHNRGQIDSNPLKEVCRKREKNKKKCHRRVPLEEKEILDLLDAIKNDTYCFASSRFKHSFYYPFLFFIFHTGVRNAEAIGLKVRHIDFENGKVEISEALARTIKGTNHAARVEKETKMGNTRYLPLSIELKELLVPQVQGKSPDCLVFKSPRGLSIDDRMLERRILKPILKKMGLGERDLYAARHSFGTRAVQQGMALTEVAYLMGHSTIETASRNYVHVGKPATILPSISTSKS